MVEMAQQFEFNRRLLELGNQIVALAQNISSTSSSKDADGEGCSLEVFSFDGLQSSESLVTPNSVSILPPRSARFPLPDPRLIRKIIRQRQLRTRIFSDSLFADPAWDILLDLTAARAEHKRVSITSLCIAAGVPATTALRWIQQLVDAGLLERCDDDRDRRRAFVSLSDTGAELIAKYFAQLEQPSSSMI